MTDMLKALGKPYVLSEHARERLAQRTSLTEFQLLRLLESKSFVRIHRKFKPDISQKDINFLSSRYGMTFDEMRACGMINLNAINEHLVVWSVLDQRPFTLLMAVEGNIVVTVLYSDDFTAHDWSDKITEKSISAARKKAEELDAAPKSTYELLACWLDATDTPKRKVFNSIKIVSITPLVPSLNELELQVRLHVMSGRDVRLIVRNRKNRADIVLEKCLDDSF